MVMVVIIVVCFVAACQRHGSDAYEDEDAQHVFDLIFHDAGFYLVFHKPCQVVKVCCTAVLGADMSKNVDISPQIKNATKVV
jgi:hypothetical protein